MEVHAPAETPKRYVYAKGTIKFLRNKSTQQGKPMLMFTVVGEHTEACTYFPSEGEELFTVSGNYFVLNI